MHDNEVCVIRVVSTPHYALYEHICSPETIQIKVPHAHGYFRYCWLLIPTGWVLISRRNRGRGQYSTIAYTGAAIFSWATN